ncbi:EthD domain-containing protein [Aspergillus homomorphus CBS 101889]|uniref:EthD domain-containing protein n=1 Tax=Aspergillus homomorphus (strain CBS 101889) TaxID=1450537 RepID=A0A395I3I3_ASPHC|nr:hypothetical protein BO97DRAFT_422720 [Aspergillus homomorphus CBS 101889]RAL14295.1 hypothetical protein BO97DRAFT_422720 [Aspergillus homomorphus CBS 101889]
MPYTLLAFLTRKAGTTPSAFKAYYETHQIPLLKKFSARTGFLWFTSGSIYPGNWDNTTVLKEEKEEDKESFPWDCCAEVVFRDQAHFEAFYGALVAAGERLQADEDRFLERGEMKVVPFAEGAVATTSFAG